MNAKTKFQNQPCALFNQVMTTVTSLLLVAGNVSAQTYKILHHFAGPDGSSPEGELTVSGTTLYGTTRLGGAYNNSGTVFKVNTDGSGYTLLHSFRGRYAGDGAQPKAGLVMSGTVLYGTTSLGGRNGFDHGGYGTVFKINTDGSGYGVLRHLDSQDGVQPSGGLILSGTTIYGTAYSLGGVGVHGTVFKLDTDGSNFIVLKAFTGPVQHPDGSGPNGRLVLSGSRLYGAAAWGGVGGWDQYGTLFSLNTDGSGFELLKTFLGGTDGQSPQSSLLLCEGMLYGTTLYGGAQRDTNHATGNGTVFRIGTGGGDYSVLKPFAGSDGRWPLGALVSAGTTLYGTTTQGGMTNILRPEGAGIVFKLNTDGSGFTVIKYFNDGDAIHPSAGLALSGTTLYGTTQYGGTNGWGVVFSLSVASPAITIPPQSQTSEPGSTIMFRVSAEGAPPLNYAWFFNGTNRLTYGTNHVLELTNCQFSLSGSYTVVVTNLFGAATSPPAMLNVIPPVERRLVPGINLQGDVGSSLNLEYTDSLLAEVNWLPLDAVSLTNTSQFYFDLTAPLPPQRFYRAWQTGAPGVIPALDLHMIPAITLAGNTGSQVQVDGVNQFGPIDAWFALDTVTLTNASQLYFDVSVIDQPKRLYRLVPLP